MLRIYKPPNSTQNTRLSKLLTTKSRPNKPRAAIPKRHFFTIFSRKPNPIQEQQIADSLAFLKEENAKMGQQIAVVQDKIKAAKARRKSSNSSSDSPSDVPSDVSSDSPLNSLSNSLKTFDKITILNTIDIDRPLETTLGPIHTFQRHNFPPKFIKSLKSATKYRHMDPSLLSSPHLRHKQTIFKNAIASWSLHAFSQASDDNLIQTTKDSQTMQHLKKNVDHDIKKTYVGELNKDILKIVSQKLELESKSSTFEDDDSDIEQLSHIIFQQKLVESEKSEQSEEAKEAQKTEPTLSSKTKFPLHANIYTATPKTSPTKDEFNEILQALQLHLGPFGMLFNGIKHIDKLTPGKLTQGDYSSISSRVVNFHHTSSNTTHSITGEHSPFVTYNTFSFSLPIHLHRNNVYLYHQRQLAHLQTAEPAKFKPTNPAVKAPTFNDFIHAGHNYDMIRYDINVRIDKGTRLRLKYSFDNLIHVPRWFAVYMNAQALHDNSSTIHTLKKLDNSIVSDVEKAELYNQINALAAELPHISPQTIQTLSHRERFIINSQIQNKKRQLIREKIRLNPFNFNFEPDSNPHKVLKDQHCVTYHESHEIETQPIPFLRFIPFFSPRKETIRNEGPGPTPGVRNAIHTVLSTMLTIDSAASLPNTPLTIQTYKDFVQNVEQNATKSKLFYIERNQTPHIYHDIDPQRIDRPVISGVGDKLCTPTGYTANYHSPPS